MTKDKITIVGCGAIGDVFYFPHLAADVALRKKVCLVDRDPVRLEIVKKKWGFLSSSTALDDFLPETKVGVVATPPGSHASVGMALLKAGADIVVEKPLTDSHADGVVLCDEADRLGRQILVNNTRRFYPQSKAIQRVVRSEQYGAIRNLEYLEGGEFSWPTVSGFYFQKQGGRGAMSDRGSHILDLICWWTGGAPQLLEARTNSLGGVEGLAECRLGLSNGVEARVKISWHNKLANIIRLSFDQTVIEADLYEIDRYTLIENGTRSVVKCLGKEKNYAACAGSFCKALKDLYTTGAKVPVSGREVLPSLKLLDTFYEQVEPFKELWQGPKEIEDKL